MDLCQWVISCASGLRACDDSCVWQKMRACVHYCMCVTIAVPSGQVVALEIGSTYPC